MTTLVMLLFFLSGACGLVYQVVWTRMMTHAFGTTALAVGTVLAAFMSGLALGSWLLGKVADKSRNRLRLYAYLEIGVAVAAGRRAVALDPGLVAGRKVLAETLLATGKRAEAAEHLRAVLKIDPHDAEARRLLSGF